MDAARAYRLIFLGYAALNLLAAVAFLFLSPAIEVERPPTLAEVSRETKRIVTKLAALFSLDAFGGGFLTDALVAYWFFRRFGAGEESLGLLFFAVHLLNAGSHLGAAWLARRIGLVNTMVFTHLPSSVFLMAVPFAPSLPVAVALFLLRESLVEIARTLISNAEQGDLAAAKEVFDRLDGKAVAATEITATVDARVTGLAPVYGIQPPAET